MKIFIYPLLFAIYCLCLPFLIIRNACHFVLVFLDGLFDDLCEFLDIEPKFLPFPKASEEPLPFESDDD